MTYNVFGGTLNLALSIYAEDYLNWFTVRKVITKNKKGELFIETWCIIMTQQRVAHCAPP